jgi:hypothetical protein
MFDAYSVAVKLRLVNAVTPGLMTISQQFTKTHRDALALQRQFEKLKLTMLAAGGVAATGFAGLGLIGKTVKAAGEYTHQLAQMRAAGMSNLEVAQATAQAWKSSGEVMTSSATENLAAIRELRMVFGNTRHAMENVSTIQKIQAILASTGHGGQGEAYTLAKALEMKGAVRTPGEFTKQADFMSKAIIASGGKVAANDFLSTFKYGRAATQGWSDQFAYQILPTLIQEMKTAGGSGGGAGGPGNALMSAYAAVVGGTIPQKALKVWQQLGLLDAHKIVWNRVGSAKGVAPGGVKGSDLFQENPYLWAQQVLLPAMKAHGYTSEKSMSEVMQYLFTNRTAGFVMRQMTMQGWKFQRDQALINKAIGLKDYNRLAKEDPVLAYQGLQKKWGETKLQLGLEVLPMLIDGTEKLTYFLRDLNTAMRNNPGITKALTVGFTALSAAMAIGGTVWLVVGAFRGLDLVLGMTKGTGLIAATTGATTSLGLFARAIGAVGIAAALWDETHSPTTKGKWGAFWNDTHWLDKRLGLYHGPHDKWDDAWGIGDHGKHGAKGSWGGGASASWSDSPYVRPRQQQPQRLQGDVYLNKEKVGKIISDSLADSMSGPQTGFSGFDLRMTPLPVGGGF